MGNFWGKPTRIEPKIIRVTMFKLEHKEELIKLAGFYKTLSGSARKDGQPYIISFNAGPAHEDARSQGYTFVAKSEFASLEDMRFYDVGCEAHQALKQKVKTLEEVKGVMTVYFDPVVGVRL